MPVEAPDFAIVTGQQVPKGIKPVYLPDLMTERNRVPSTLEWIQRLLRQEVRAGLPQALIDQLGFAELRWQLVYNRHSLPLLFVGTPTLPYKSIYESINLAEATGTIYLNRRVSGNPDDRVVCVSHLGVAGVGRASNGSTRVLAALYNPSHKQAYHINVSVSPPEFPYPSESAPYSYKMDYDYAARPIPSRQGTVYHIGGIVTKGMVLATAVDRQNGHMRVFSSFDMTLQGTEVRPIDYGRSSEDLGFRVWSSDDSFHQVSYQPPRRAAGLSAWQVDFPKRLG